MKVAFIFPPSRRSFSLWYQYKVLATGLEEEGVRTSLLISYSNGLTHYDVKVWWAPFRTIDFEQSRFKVDIIFNPIDTNDLSDFVIRRLKTRSKVVIVPSTHNLELMRKHGINAELVPHGIMPEDIPEDCELREDMYYVETRSFPIRRGTDIALSYNLNYLVTDKVFKDHKDFLKFMCTAGNIIAPSRGGAFDVEVLEALAMGMRVYYSARKMFDYIKDIPPTFPIDGEYCNTEYGYDVYQYGCYDNVIRVEELKEVPRPNAKMYIKSHSPREIAKRFMEVVDKWLS